jgi:serine/threonine protein kinase
MVTGRHPFLGSGATLIDAILNHPAPAPMSINKSIGGHLQRVILKAIEKDPKRRYQSAPKCWPKWKHWPQGKPNAPGN